MAKKIYRKRSTLPSSHLNPQKEKGASKDCSEKGFKMIKLPGKMGWSNKRV